MQMAMRATARFRAKGAAASEPIQAVTGGATLLPMILAAYLRLCGMRQPRRSQPALGARELAPGEG